jgi:uncharacterized repeat protein (TIGR03837 family)
MQRSVNSLQWDIFCKVIDNFGDIGIGWRLAADLASRGQRVRLWVDDASALAWMAPPGCDGVQVLPWAVGTSEALRPADLQSVGATPPDVMIEAFGCQIAPEFIAACARIQGAVDQKSARPVWINLEYLSAEPYAERNHSLPSLIQHGPAAGWTKWFFYPGFSAKTGGLLREPNLATRQAAFDATAWLHAHGVNGAEAADATLVSLFCYEPPLLAALLHQWAESGIDGKPVHLLVASGRATDAVLAAWGKNDPKNAILNPLKQLQPNEYRRGQLSISYLPLLSQTDFDHLLWACDINFVRGEDSIVRAIWAGKPFVWQIYPQDDGVHTVKLDAFLNMLGAPPSLRDFHRHWNAPDAGAASPRPWQTSDLTAWQQTANGAQARLMANRDLSSSLMEFVSKNR